MLFLSIHESRYFFVNNNKKEGDMNIITIILTGFALAMDAFAVSVTKGMMLKNLTKKMAIKIALFFGVFQAAMPLIGWLLGISFQGYIQAIDHWIALILLSILGGKMIYEFYENRKEAKEEKNEAANEASTTLEEEGINNISNSNKYRCFSCRDKLCIFKC